MNELIAWLTAATTWQGETGIPFRLLEHLAICAVSVAAATAIALPIGLYIGHTGRGARVAVAVSNIGRAIPSLGWLGIAYPISTGLFQRAGLGFLPAFIGLVALAIPPIVTNTYAGLRDVDPDLREAARGMGMGELQLLARVEVPVALTVILAGIRVSAVSVVATAPLAALVGAGTLGSYILQGLALSDEVRVVAAALLVAVLAILTELGFSWLQRRAVSPGLAGADGGPLEASPQVPWATGAI